MGNGATIRILVAAAISISLLGCEAHMTIKGEIVSFNTGDSIRGCSAQLSNSFDYPERSLITKTNGAFRTRWGIPPVVSEYEIIFSCPGHVEIRRNVYFPFGATTGNTFDLGRIVLVEDPEDDAT